MVLFLTGLKLIRQRSWSIRVQVDHTISSIELIETDTNSAVYVGGSNKVTKIHLAGDPDDPEDGKLPPLPETSTLVVNASNLSHFGGSIGATNPLTGLVTDAPGVTVLSGNVTTTGDHTFLDPVQLQADVDLLGTGFSALEAGAIGSFHLNAFANSGTRIEGVSQPQFIHNEYHHSRQWHYQHDWAAAI